MNAPVKVRCDMCGQVVTSEVLLDYFGDCLGVDWAHCSACATTSTVEAAIRYAKAVR